MEVNKFLNYNTTSFTSASSPCQYVSLYRLIHVQSLNKLFFTHFCFALTKNNLIVKGRGL